MDSVYSKCQSESFQYKGTCTHEIHESTDIVSLEDTVRSQRVEDWVYHVQETLGGLISLPAEDIACRNRHWAV